MIRLAINNMQTKKWYNSRTIWFSVLTALVGILTVLNAQFPTEGWMITVIGVINVLLRIDTSTVLE